MFLRHIHAISFMGLVFFTGKALATETRLEVLRYNGGIEDETLTFTYPGQIGKYHVALIELGTSENRKAYGAAMADAGGFNIGMALSRDEWLFTSPWLGRSGLNYANVSMLELYETAMLGSTTPSLYRPARPIEFLAGFGVAGGTLGLRLSFADYKSKSDETVATVASSNKYTAQHSQVAVGFSAGTFDVALTLDPSANQKRAESSGGAESSTTVKGSAMALDGRWVGAENTSSFYGKGRYASRNFKASGRLSGRDFSSKFTDQLFSVEGGYIAMREATGPKLFTGIELLQNSSKGPTVVSGTGTATIPSYASSSESAKLDTTVVSSSLSGEATVAGGFGMMAGMHYVMFGDVTLKDNTTNQQIKRVVSFPETTDDVLWSLGLYYKVDALRIDASYGKEFLHNGPFLISGNSTKPLLRRISATYSF